MVVVGGPKLGGNAGSECNIRGGMEGGGGGHKRGWRPPVLAGILGVSNTGCPVG